MRFGNSRRQPTGATRGMTCPGGPPPGRRSQARGTRGNRSPSADFQYNPLPRARVNRAAGLEGRARPCFAFAGAELFSLGSASPGTKTACGDVRTKYSVLHGIDPNFGAVIRTRGNSQKESVKILLPLAKITRSPRAQRGWNL